MESLTERLRTKLELTYDGIWDTPHSFQYLTRFSIIPSSAIIATTLVSSNYHEVCIHFLPGLRS